MKHAIILILITLLLSCAHTPPVGAKPGQISVDSSSSPIKWKSYLDKYIPKGINDYAGYKVVNGAKNTPYRIKVNVVNSERIIGGINKNGNINYVMSAEVEALLINESSGEIVWEWAGYATKGAKPFHDARSRTMHSIAKQLGKAMREAKLLDPSYYKSKGE